MKYLHVRGSIHGAGLKTTEDFRMFVCFFSSIPRPCRLFYSTSAKTACPHRRSAHTFRRRQTRGRCSVQSSFHLVFVVRFEWGEVRPQRSTVSTILGVRQFLPFLPVSISFLCLLLHLLSEEKRPDRLEAVLFSGARSGVTCLPPRASRRGRSFSADKHGDKASLSRRRLLR